MAEQVWDDPIVQQIEGLMVERIVTPALTLLGEDIGEQARECAEVYAAQLRNPDRRIAAQTAIDLAILLPDAIPAEWWATPLGQAMASEAPLAITVAEAARILGVTRARAYVLAHDGKITPAPGGVTLTSVLERLAGLPILARARERHRKPTAVGGMESSPRPARATGDRWPVPDASRGRMTPDVIRWPSQTVPRVPAAPERRWLDD